MLFSNPTVNIFSIVYAINFILHFLSIVFSCFISLLSRRQTFLYILFYIYHLSLLFLLFHRSFSFWLFLSFSFRLLSLYFSVSNFPSFFSVFQSIFPFPLDLQASFFSYSLAVFSYPCGLFVSVLSFFSPHSLSFLS